MTTHPTGREDSGSPLSDQRLRQLAEHLIQVGRLRSWAGQIQVECRSGTITLSGRLPSFYLKQVLQTLVGQLPGVRAVVNQVQVVRGPHTSGAESDRDVHVR